MGGFVTQMESCRFILEAKHFCIWKENNKKRRIKKNMSPIFFLPFVYFTDQTKMTLNQKIAIKPDLQLHTPRNFAQNKLAVFVN